MNFTPLPLAGAFLLTSKPHWDERGYFMRSFDETIFQDHGLTTHWVQESQSLSRKSVIRGLHFQIPPYAEAKLVRVLTGVIWDVFVDLRVDSPSYGQWHAIELAAESFQAVYLPRGFAHGFCVLSREALVMYKMDAYFVLSHQAGLRWNDPTLAIPWPVQQSLVSAKDQQHPFFKEFSSPFRMEYKP